MNERNQLMRDIQIVSFLVKDVQLFLDTHPMESDALSYFEYYNNLLGSLTSDYESKFGPLTIRGVNVDNGWSWINEPWPWEKEA